MVGHAAVIVGVVASIVRHAHTGVSEGAGGMGFQHGRLEVAGDEVALEVLAEVGEEDDQVGGEGEAAHHGLVVECQVPPYRIAQMPAKRIR